MKWLTHGIVGALLITLPSISAAQAKPACTRPAARPHALGATTTIGESKSFPCRIEIRATGVELLANATTIPDIDPGSVARDSRGRFYASNGQGQISVWSSDGKFMQSVGRIGKGPGEFAKGPMTIVVGPGDTLYVRDNTGRWTVLNPSHAYVRQFGWGRTEDERGTMVILPGSQMLIGGIGAVHGAKIPNAFWVADLSGAGGTAGPTISRTFGGPAISRPAPSSPPFADPTRLITTVVAGAFWSGPPRNEGLGYLLQQWSVSGVLQQAIRRDVEWYKAGSDRIVPSPKDEEGLFDGPPPPTAIRLLHADGSGLVFTATPVVNGNWARVAARLRGKQHAFEDETVFDDAIDVWLEVIDTNAGVVLASEKWPAKRFREEGLLGFFSGGSMGYRKGETPDGSTAIQIVELRLVAK